jgi:hypothetical protein
MFNGQGFEDVLDSCGEDGEDGECAIFLVLFKSTAEAGWVLASVP